MAKQSKLTKLKYAALKKWHSFGKSTRNSSSISAEYEHQNIITTTSISTNAHPVYVGKSRRRYLINSDVIHHPLFQELAAKSNEESNETIIACEVVLFEHLLWMIENADPQPESSMDELVQFYAY